MSSSSPVGGYGSRIKHARHQAARRRNSPSAGQSFAHISEPQARRAKEAIQELEGWIDRFPEFEEIARQTIKSIRRQARRTPQSDRDKVLAVFERAITALTLEDVADDAGLPHKDVQTILEEFVNADIIEMRSPGGSRNCGRGGTNWLYCFVGTASFSPVLTQQNI
jgi:hypothetical protein